MQIKGSGNIFCTLTFQTEGFVMNKFDSELDDLVVDCLRYRKKRVPTGAWKYNFSPV